MHILDEFESNSISLMDILILKVFHIQKASQRFTLKEYFISSFLVGLTCSIAYDLFFFWKTTDFQYITHALSMNLLIMVFSFLYMIPCTAFWNHRAKLIQTKKLKYSNEPQVALKVACTSLLHIVLFIVFFYSFFFTLYYKTIYQYFFN